MLTIVPANWWSWNFDIMDGAQLVARVDMSGWRERGVLTIGDTKHRVYREGVRGAFILECGGIVQAKAVKPSAFRTLLIIEYNGRDYTLHKKSAWRSAFVLVDESDNQIGSLGRKSMWGREAAAVLPDEWPVPIRAFAIWLTLAMWKRESDGAVAAAAT